MSGRLAIGVAQEEAQVLLGRVEAASDIGRAVERLVSASLSLSRSRHRKTKQSHGTKLGQRRTHAYV
jgi:hypothetical protein